MAPIMAMNVPLLKPKQIQTVSATSVTPFPKWLTEFTGLKTWPGIDPPYIPLDFIDFSKIEPAAQHLLGECANLGDTCSFDCSNCVAPDDIFTCPKLSQTFDDGPTPNTVKLINNLRSPSTFFTLGVNVVKHPNIYKQTMAKGNVMGSHTWSHKFLPSLSNEAIIAQLEWSIWAMNATGNHLPKWFRPPYGGLDNRVRSIVRQFGMSNVLWNYDTTDWQMLSGGKTLGQVLKDIGNYYLRNPTGGLILEHDHSLQTVDVGIEINKQISSQLTVPQCVGGNDYLKTFRL